MWLSILYLWHNLRFFFSLTLFLQVGIYSCKIVPSQDKIPLWNNLYISFYVYLFAPVPGEGGYDRSKILLYKLFQNRESYCRYLPSFTSGTFNVKFMSQ
jgi:hypothetical protein